MGRDESRFNVLLIVRDKVARQCQQTTTFEEKAEPKRNRTEVPLLSTLTIYREAKPAHCLSDLFSIHPHPKGGLMSPSCVTCYLRAIIWLPRWVRQIVVSVIFLCLSCSFPDHSSGKLSILTLQGSLSGTVLQTLQLLVTPLKCHSLSRHICRLKMSEPSERLGY